MTLNPNDLSSQVSEISFASTDKTKLSGWLVKPTSLSVTTVVFVHGIGENRVQHHHFELSKHFSSEGISSLLFDLRGHGTSADSIASAGFFEQRDVIAAVNQIPTNNCRIIFGSSMGAATAILAAKQLGTEVDGLIVDSSYADIKDLLVSEISNSLSWSPSIARIFIPATSFMANLMYSINLSQLKITDVISKIPYSVLIIHGESDSRIPVSQAHKLYEAAPAESKLIIVPDAGHTFSYVKNTEAYTLAVDQYIQNSCKNAE